MNGNGPKIFNVVISIMATLSLGISAWALSSIVKLREDNAAMNANRFTSADGLEVWQEIAKIREEMAHKADVDRVPPPEVVRWLERLDDLSHGHPS